MLFGISESEAEEDRSCIVSQLVFSLGGSIFPGGNGSMMIEAVPFFHILVNIIQQEVGDDVSASILSLESHLTLTGTEWGNHRNNHGGICLQLDPYW